MSRQTFTQGPWTVHAPKPARFPEYQITDATDAYVASVQIRASNPANNDARLIAAAPDLAAALKAINSRLNELAQDGNKKPNIRDLNDFQRWSAHALAKAGV